MGIAPLGRKPHACCLLSSRCRKVTCVSCPATYLLCKYSQAHPLCQMLVSQPSSVCARGANNQHRKWLPKSQLFLVFHLLPVSHSLAPYALWNSHWYLVFRYHAYDLGVASGHDLVNTAFWALFCRSSSFSSRAREFEPVIIQLACSLDTPRS